MKIRGNSIADVLGMTVDAAYDFFADDPSLRRSLGVIRDVGLGYIRLGQSATELSGGEAQRVKLATGAAGEPRRRALRSRRTRPDFIPPTSRSWCAARSGWSMAATVILVEHDIRVVAGSDWVIDMGPGAGEDGGKVMAAGTPTEVAGMPASRTAPHLANF